MRIKDDYEKTGHDFESFIEEIGHFVAKTKILKSRNANFRILSFKEKTEKGYAFFELKEEVVNSFNNGVYEEFPIKVFVPETPGEAALFEEARKTGMIINYNGVIFFVAREVVLGLADRAGIKGARITTPSLARDLYISEGLQDAGKRAGDDGVSKLIYRTEQLENATRVARKVVALRGGRYQFASLKGIKSAAETVFAEEKFGRKEIVCWKTTNTNAAIKFEFPDLADKFREEYGLPDKIIPGILINDSDVGLSSLAVRPTFRYEGTAVGAALQGKSWQHVSEYRREDVDNYISNVYMGVIEEVMRALKGKSASKLPAKSIPGTFDAWEKELQLAGAIGKKKCMQLKNSFKAKTDSLPKSYTEYDLAKEFVLLTEAFSFTPSAMRKYMNAIGNIPFVSTKNIVAEWGKE